MVVGKIKETVAMEEMPIEEPRYDSLIFDLDDTLYPLSSGLAHSCRENIERYMIEHLKIDPAIVPDMCTKMYKTYGTTMAGLWTQGYYFDHDDWHRCGVFFFSFSELVSFTYFAIFSGTML